jgi:hypothetical protein
MFLFKMLLQEDDVEFPFKRKHRIQFVQTPPVVLLQVEVQPVIVGQVIVSLP